MTAPDPHALYELDILRHVEQDSRLNNRQAAGKLGVSIRLAHALLRRMVQKGLLQVRVVHSRRWDYFLTPAGLAEKTRLTLEFIEFSLHFYREARRQSARLCRELAESGHRRVAFLGAGELAEITYLGVQEWGLKLETVYDDGAGERFLGVSVRPWAELARARHDAVIVCLYDRSLPLRQRYLPEGVPARATFRWLFEPTEGPS
jgi:DNA-binding MarR family transcriptional regulator